MKKPTIEEVKEYFKNAENISTSGGIVKLGSNNIYYQDEFYWVKFNKAFYILWSEIEGYAKILTYKKPSFRPIAMRCNKDQFEAFKHKLIGYKTDYITPFIDSEYLINYLVSSGQISNATSYWVHETHKKDYEIHETWNEKVFLDACGIEVEEEETFVITKDQLKELHPNCCGEGKECLNQWFPKAFEEEKKELVVGRWHFVERPKSQFNDHKKALIFYEDKDKLYGFTHGGWWTNDYGNPKSDSYIFTEATEQEVFEALKKEAVKQGYDKENTCVKSLIFKEDIINLSNSGYEQTGYQLLGSRLLYNGVTIFKDGTWAKIIPTISIKEAEKRLNCKIV